MALVVALFCVPLFIGLDRTDVENDEAGYSYGVEKMLETGDWLTPRGIYDGESPFLEKPPLKFWIVYFPIKWGLLPASPFGLRFWDALMGSLAFLYVFAIGRRLAGPVCGVAAVLVLFTHQALMFQHGLRTNNMEAALLLQYAGTMYHFMAWRSAKGSGRLHLIAVALYFVLGFMTKFVAAAFAPFVLALVVVVSAEDRRRFWRQRLGVVMAGGLAAALILPWFIYQYRVFGAQLIEQMFGEHVFKRFTTFIDRTHVQPWDFYFSQLWTQLQPGTRVLVVAGAALLMWHVIRRRWIDGGLVILWFAVPVTVISTGTSKLDHYMYPFLPPVALAGGYAVALLASWAWHLIERPVDAMVRARDSALPSAISRPWPRSILMVTAAAAGAIAVATWLFGSLRAPLGPVLLRNSSVIRPIVVAAVAFIAGASATAIRVIVVTALVLAPLPTQAYGTTLQEIMRISRPMTNLQACMMPLLKKDEVEGRKLPGVWVESTAFSHTFFYYLRHFGPWQPRGVGSDSTVAMHVFAPATYRPVLLSRKRFDEFRAAMALDEPGALATAARRAPMDLEKLRESAQQSAVGAVDFDHEILLLPGPYALCGTRILPPLLPAR